MGLHLKHSTENPDIGVLFPLPAQSTFGKSLISLCLSIHLCEYFVNSTAALSLNVALQSIKSFVSEQHGYVSEKNSHEAFGQACYTRNM